jgi:CRISPR-associated protein Cst2
VLRVTQAHSSRIQNCFEHDEERRAFEVTRLVARIKNGDIPASEVIVGGEVAATADGAHLKKLGATVFDGVNAAASEARARIAKLGGAFAVVGAESTAG